MVTPDRVFSPSVNGFGAPRIYGHDGVEALEKIREEQSMVDATHLMNLDATRSEGAPYLDFVWLWEGSAKGYAEKEHVHDFDEFIGFIGVK